MPIVHEMDCGGAACCAPFQIPRGEAVTIFEDMVAVSKMPGLAIKG